MGELEISFNRESPSEKGSTIEIKVTKFNNEKLLYKFIIGSDGIWDTVKDFSEEFTARWTPERDGKYIIMVQAKKKNSAKPFDYLAKNDYIIGRVEEKIINSIEFESSNLTVGDKLQLTVYANKAPVVYKYWIKSGDKWELLKDYSAEDSLSMTVRNAGKQELLIECRALESKNNFDDFKKVEFEVKSIEKLEITDFQCLTEDMLTDSEMIFQVEAKHEDNRMVLYKFVKINPHGKAECIQDYSTKRIVSYIEKEPGAYQLLCLAKDMYSPVQYDDRAIIDYEVKLYNPIEIQSFTTDLISPQISDSTIELKAVVKGGRKLLYRFIIEGNCPVDSGYTENSSFSWKPERAGEYKLKLWVKDKSYEDKYEAEAELDYVIDEISKNKVKITDILLNKDKDFIINESVNIKVIADGGVDLKYSFIISKDCSEKEKIEYGNCSWVNFTAEEAGTYQLEVRVKDKYSRQEYDTHEIINFEVKEYLPAEIDYILMPAKEIFMVGDTMRLDIVARRTSNILINYILKINEHKVEETGFVEGKRYLFTPKCSGNYSVEILAKDKASTALYDTKKVMNFSVQDSIPVSNTKILLNTAEINVNEPVMFSVEAQGGRDLQYEFYLMEHEEWNLVQRYSKMNYYTFMPFKTGNYKILALVKSGYKDCAYEDYNIMEFNV